LVEHPKVTIEPHILDQLRDICLELPKAHESEAFGAPTFQIGKKNFAMTHRGKDDRPSVWVKAVPGRQEALVSAFPDRYYRPPYLGGNGWLGCWLDDTALPDWDEIEDLVIDSYRLIAPKRLVNMLSESEKT
jgi:predicted DNA-binding protein (MmcQ/YjbR family)